MSSLLPLGGSVTGVGSLPLLNTEEAVEFVSRQCPELPFWPQLPRRCEQEGMIAQSLGSLVQYLDRADRQGCWEIARANDAKFFEALKRDSGALRPENASGFFELERWLGAGRFPQALAIKAQLTGPITLSNCLFRSGRPVADSPEWVELLSEFLIRRAIWQVRRLQETRKPVILVIDEPLLNCATVNQKQSSEALSGTERLQQALALLLTAIKSAGAHAGLHCCAALPPAFSCGLSIDYFSFDSHLSLDQNRFMEWAYPIAQHGGLLAFGLIPTTRPTTVEDVATLTSVWLSLALRIGDVRTIARQSVVTATCGLGLSTPEAANDSFGTARQVGQDILAISP